MAKVLDRSKPFGTVYGVDEDGAVYTQGGRKFRGDGSECGSKPAAQASSGASDSEKDARIAELEKQLADAQSGGGDDNSDDDKSAEEKLSELHPAQLKKLIEEKGGVAASGPGSAAENVKILMALLEAEGAE